MAAHNNDMFAVIEDRLTADPANIVLGYLDIDRATACEFYQVFRGWVDGHYMIDERRDDVSSWRELAEDMIEQEGSLPDYVMAVINWPLWINDLKSDWIRIGSSFYLYTPDMLCDDVFDALGWNECYGVQYLDSDGKETDEKKCAVISYCVPDGHGARRIIKADAKTKMDIDHPDTHIVMSFTRGGRVEYVRRYRVD